MKIYCNSNSIINKTNDNNVRSLLEFTHETVTPEQYGAIGDGVTDNYIAFSNMIDYVNSIGGAIIKFGESKNYKIDRYIGDSLEPIAKSLEFKKLSFLNIIGNNSKITIKGDFQMTKGSEFGGYYRSNEKTIIISILRSNNIRITNLEIDGQGDLMTFEDGINGEQNANSGLHIGGCKNVFLNNVYVHGYSCDALMLGESEGNDTGKWIKYTGANIKLNNCRFEYASRNAMSLGCVQNVEFNDCIFGYAGDNGNGNIGYSPGLAVDIEPDFGAGSGYECDTNDIRFNRCTFKECNGGLLAIPMTYVSNVYFNDCDFIDNIKSKTYVISCSGHNIHIKNSRIKMYNTMYFDRLSTMGKIYFENNDIDVVNTSLITCTSDSKSPVYMTGNNITLRTEYDSPNPMPIYCSSNILIFKNNNVFCSDTLKETKLFLRGCRECSNNIYTTDRTTGNKFGVFYRWARKVENETYASEFIQGYLEN